MSKAAAKQIAQKQHDLKRNVDFLGADRLEEASFRGADYRLVLPKEMADEIETSEDLERKLSNPTFWREVNTGRRIVAGDEFRIIAPRFYARVWMRGYAASVYADPKVLFKVDIADEGTNIIGDTGSKGHTVKYVDPYMGWCVLDADEKIVSSKHYTREKAISELQRITATGIL